MTMIEKRDDDRAWADDRAWGRWLGKGTMTEQKDEYR